MRDASVALMVLAVLAFVFRRRHEKRTLIDLPPGALCVGLLLLVVVPDKLPWHFGALLGLGAVAIAAETIRLREDAASAGGWNARPFLVLGTVMAAISWVWATPTPWTVIDLRTLDWVRAIDRLQFAVLAILVPLLVMVVATFVAMRRRVQPWRVPWSVAPWSALMMAVPVVAFTVGVLVADTLKTPGWTPARQNLAAFRGNAGCGFGDDYRVVLPASARPAGGTASAVLPLPAWVPPSPSPGLPRFVLGPTAAPSATSPWFRVPASLPIGLFVTGAPSDSNPLSVEWGARRGVGVETLARGKLPVTTSLQGGQSKSGGMDVGTSPWHLFSQADLPTRPPDADVVRLTLATAPPPGPAVAVTAPVTYSTTPLTSLINAARPALVNFSLVPYLPCASLPKLQNGLAEVPGLVVRPLAKATAASRTQSPFAGLLDLYSASYAPGADSAFSLRNIVVFQVDRTIPGGIVALPAEAAGS
jgi:hypothetical protein